MKRTRFVRKEKPVKQEFDWDGWPRTVAICIIGAFVAFMIWGKFDNDRRLREERRDRVMVIHDDEPRYATVPVTVQRDGSENTANDRYRAWGSPGHGR